MKSNIFSKSTLIPAVIQDEKSKLVYMVGYMNQHALDLTIATKRVHFWSRSKGRIWMKGETSGNTLSVVQIIADCDEDALSLSDIVEKDLDEDHLEDILRKTLKVTSQNRR